MLSSTQTEMKIQNTNNAANNRTGGKSHHLQISTIQKAPIPEGRSSDSGNVNGMLLSYFYSLHSKSISFIFTTYSQSNTLC